MQLLDGLAAGGQLPPQTAETLRQQAARLRERFDSVARAIELAAPPVQVSQAQSAEYQAFAQSLREMALLEASMQSVAESGQRVLQRLQLGRERLNTA